MDAALSIILAALAYSLADGIIWAITRQHMLRNRIELPPLRPVAAFIGDGVPFLDEEDAAKIVPVVRAP